MNTLPRLLNCLIIGSVAVMTGSAAWAKPRTEGALNNAPAWDLSDNPYLNGPTSDDRAKPNPYLSGAPAEKASPNPYLANIPTIGVVKPKPAPTAAAGVSPHLASTVASMAKSTAHFVNRPNPYLAITTVTVTEEPNPYLARELAPAKPNPYLRSITVASVAPMGYTMTDVPTGPTLPAVEKWVKAPVQVVPTETAWKPRETSAPNPYKGYGLAFSQASSITTTQLDIGDSMGQLFDGLRSVLPSVPPLSEVAILPTIKTVYPTGDKPLKVLTFKCPTELIGITPLPTKALHLLVTAGMDAINSTNLLPFNMQQVCQ